MARVEIPYVVQDTSGNAINGASIYVYQRGTTTPISVWNAETAGGTVSLPLTTGADGRINGWVNEGQSIDLRVSGSGFTTYTQPWEAVRGDAVIDTAHIADNSITAIKLQAGSVTQAKLSNPIVFRTTQTYAILGEIKVPSGDSDYIPPFYVAEASRQTTKLVKIISALHGGTSVSWRIQKNGADWGWGTSGTSIVTTPGTSPRTTDNIDTDIADGDSISLLVSAVSGTPVNFTVSLVFEHSVTI